MLPAILLFLISPLQIDGGVLTIGWGYIVGLRWTLHDCSVSEPNSNDWGLKRGGEIKSFLVKPSLALAWLKPEGLSFLAYVSIFVEICHEPPPTICYFGNPGVLLQDRNKKIIGLELIHTEDFQNASLIYPQILHCTSLIMRAEIKILQPSNFWKSTFLS